MPESYKDLLENCTELLKNNKNLILTGAPGTGKTYLAKEIAKKLIGQDDIENSNQYKFVQFHPSYDYTDFVEGLRPTQPDENCKIGFERKDGVFKEFCGKAISNKNDQQNNVNSLNVSNKEILTSIVIKYINNCIDKKIKLSTPTQENDETNGFTIIELSKNNVAKCNVLKAGKDHSFNVADIIPILLKMYNKKIGEKKEDGKYKIQTKDIKKTNNSYSAGFCNAFFNDPNNGVTENMSNDSSNPYFVFVIDEINRGEISKIFGELFFSIDPGYRGKKGIVQTQYQNMIDDETDPFKDGFYIPENVYIIGTMNDIDRSVESMDFAMRRRFAWQEIKAGDTQDMLSELGDKQQEAKNRMDNINNAIIDKYNYNNDTYKDIQIGLTPAYQIGASYFLKLKNYGNDFEKLWNYHIKGLLFEYLRGQEDADKKLKALHSAYELINQQENNEPNNNN